ncbi:alpha/beta fold hydrolase [Alkalihalobacterium bogoriense]|uniref:alpha/beta fold hydrolase n=1 Tax=Alkalihalobacterium bogoriense TaxID=246272 RepID=UPI000686EE79|nr:alpha/beta hydrolase [Alkalihalobacterium bogoriense]
MLLESNVKPLINMNKKTEKGTVTKEYLKINGVRQGIIIESLNQANPLLLFLHGGPGFPIYPAIKAYGTNLQQYFTVCYWDQRGAGMSYNKKETEKPLTVEQLVDDTIEVIHYLREKYSQDKIFLMGHSWGTYLGSLVASKQPEFVHAYIGVGQIGSQKESENETYNYILNTAKNQNDHRAIKEIEKVTFDENYYKNHSYAVIRKKYTDIYGGGFKRDGYSFFKTLKHTLTCPNYTFKERKNILYGSYYSYKSLAHTLGTTDLVKLVPSLNLPVFIIQGHHDLQTTHTQAKRFYESIEAPQKKMFTFEHSSHSPFLDEPERFHNIIQDDVLAIM